MGNDEVETNEKLPNRSFAKAVEPNFWNPAYRSNRVVNTYVEVDYAMYQKWGVNSEAKVRQAFTAASTILESLTGIKIVIPAGQVKVWTTPDPWNASFNSNFILLNWGNAVFGNPNQFKHFISGKGQLGGLAYIFRGEVTQSKFAISSSYDGVVGNDTQYSFLVYCIIHELLHNLGVSHSQNCCAWKDQNGSLLGRLDSCWQSEITCSPSPVGCTTTTKPMKGGINGYCHVYGMLEYKLHPAVLAVLHRAVFYSDLPTYAPVATPPCNCVMSLGPCINGTQTVTFTATNSPCTGTCPASYQQACAITKTVSVKGTPYKGYTLADTIKAVNGITTDRWLSTGPTTVTWTFSAPVTINWIRLQSGYQGGSPNQTLTLTCDGVNVPLNFNKTIDFTGVINATGRVFRATTTGVSNISRVFEISLSK
jgi:hypothetical protein